MMDLGRRLVDLEIFADQWRFKEAVNIIIGVEDESDASEIAPVKLQRLGVQLVSLG
jgi:hypothetical protein